MRGFALTILISQCCVICFRNMCFFLFVGYGMNDPLDLDLALKHNAEMFKSAAQQHYLLLCDPSDNDRDRYERSYNVRVIPYSAHVQVPEFLAQLAIARTTPA
ncbi:hypothetical protein BE21_22910 [Sorangium cellulosum]|uniref:Uncharacterized protein n=1 Tax=Sorangium cellulosum TaxID=56 RepID=A0A150TV44_SORCE|nr:hypothetical protein BE21_22910 [Sorangium cellulosum]